jgi:hypothetical protein
MSHLLYLQFLDLIFDIAEIFLIVKSCRFPIVSVDKIRYNPSNNAIYYNLKWKAIVIGNNCTG